VKRQLTMPAGVVWLAVVMAAWLVTMPLLAVLIEVTARHTSVGGLVGLAAVSATFACIVVGGTATAVALRVRRSHSQRRAVLSGLATAGLVLLFFYSYFAATGAQVEDAWQALLPLVIITTAELALALRLRRYCREEQPPGQTPPGPPPDQPEAAALPRPTSVSSRGRTPMWAGARGAVTAAWR
jgi:hypothetical protein